MEVGNIGTSNIDVGTREAIDTKGKAYEAARDRGDTIEAARAILQKIGLMSKMSLTRETAKGNQEIEEAAFLQAIAGWVEDYELSSEDVIQNMLNVADEAALDSFLQDRQDLDFDGFKDALAADRDALRNKIETAERLSTTHSNTQAMSLKDLLHQQEVLMSLGGELTGLIKGLKSTLNDRS